MFSGRVSLITKRLLLFVVMLAVSVSALPAPKVRAVSPWLDPLHNPTVTVSQDHFVGNPPNWRGAPCVDDTKVVTRPYKITATYPYYQTEKTQNICSCTAIRPTSLGYVAIGQSRAATAGVISAGTGCG